MSINYDHRGNRTGIPYEWKGQPVSRAEYVRNRREEERQRIVRELRGTPTVSNGDGEQVEVPNLYVPDEDQTAQTSAEVERAREQHPSNHSIEERG